MTMKDRILILAVCVLGALSAILWRDNRRMARHIRLLEGAESLMSRRMLEIEEERLRLERLRYLAPPPPWSR